MNLGIAVGIGAGLASALVLVAAATGSTILALFSFIFLAPLPIIIAGLGWGWAAGIVAAIVSALVMLALGQPKAAALHLFAIGLPMAAFAYFLLLNRSYVAGAGGQPTTEWYPVGRVIGLATLVAGSLAALAMYSVAPNLEGLESEIRRVVDRLAKGELPLPQGSVAKPGEAELDAFAKLMTQSFAAAVASFWMALACLNLWLGGLITHASGRMARPWPNLTELALPRSAPLVFAGAIALSFLPGYPGLVASGFGSAMFFAYLLVGLAIIHNLTRANAARPFILFAVYFALVALNPFSGIVVSMIGIAEPISPLRRSFGTRPPAPPD